MRRLPFIVAVLLAACHKAPPPGQNCVGSVCTPCTGSQCVPNNPRWPPSGARTNPIPAENQKAGDPDWHGFKNSWNHHIEAYADRVSAKAGDTAQVMVSVDVSHPATWQLYRIGWYGGAGARKVVDGGQVALAHQPTCANDTTTGLVHCAWPSSFSVTIPADAVSGLYLVRIVRDDYYGTFVPLVVRDDRQSDLYVQSSVTTFQAYNAYGNESLYTDADDAIPGHKAVAVSFDRPYGSRDGTADLLRWEAFFARYLERYGYDVSYTTNLDVALEGAAALKKHGVFLSVGHDEYWPVEERNAADDARDAGVPLLFFGANPAYWKVRLSAPGADGKPRVMTCYKQFPAKDPMVGTPQATGRFRDVPFNRPEEALVGVMYESWLLLAHPWVVADDRSFLYTGTGLANGDVLPNLVGYEYDRTFDHDTPAVADVVARSPVVDAEGMPGFAESTIYTAPSGALVFGAGTIYWSTGLDGALRDPRVERMTANLLLAAAKVPVPQELQTPTSPAASTPRTAWATSVRTQGHDGGMLGPAAVTQLPDGTLVVADPRANRLWSVSPSGAIAPFAGDGNPSGVAAYDNVPALRARFFGPAGVIADPAGNVYVADTHNDVIRKIANDANRTVTTIAGVFHNGALTDGVGAAARLNNPTGLAWQGSGHLVIADTANHAIRVLEIATGKVTTLAGGNPGDDLDGPAATAQFTYPTAVAVAPDGRVFFLASAAGKLKQIGTDTAHTVTTLVGGGVGYADGAGDTARLSSQAGLVWANGVLLASDAANQRLRKITPGATAAATTVETWAGTGKVGAVDGSASSASFGEPLGMWLSSNGTLYVVDGGNLSVRAVQP